MLAGWLARKCAVSLSERMPLGMKQTNNAADLMAALSALQPHGTGKIAISSYSEYLLLEVKGVAKDGELKDGWDPVGRSVMFECGSHPGGGCSCRTQRWRVKRSSSSRGHPMSRSRAILRRTGCGRTARPSTKPLSPNPTQRSHGDKYSSTPTQMRSNLSMHARGCGGLPKDRFLCRLTGGPIFQLKPCNCHFSLTMFGTNIRSECFLF